MVCLERGHPKPGSISVLERGHPNPRSIMLEGFT